MEQNLDDIFVEVYGTRSYSEYLEELGKVKIEVHEIISGPTTNYGRISEISQQFGVVLDQLKASEVFRKDVVEIVKPDYVDICRIFEILQQIDEIFTPLEYFLADKWDKLTRSN
jgi:hypothetical protein